MAMGKHRDWTTSRKRVPLKKNSAKTMVTKEPVETMANKKYAETMSIVVKQR